VQAVEPPAEPPQAARPVEPTFCERIEDIVGARYTGFAGVQGQGTGDRRYTANIVPRGMSDCEIEGRRPLTARYICTSTGYLGGGPAMIEGEFEDYARKLDQCLQSPGWRPRIWRRGDRLIFGDDERMYVWRDIGRGQQQEISLKMERDLLSDIFYLRMVIAPRSKTPIFGS
jgi:hypothetical protein